MDMDMTWHNHARMVYPRTLLLLRIKRGMLALSNKQQPPVFWVVPTPLRRFLPSGKLRCGHIRIASCSRVGIGFVWMYGVSLAEGPVHASVGVALGVARSIYLKLGIGGVVYKELLLVTYSTSL